MWTKEFWTATAERVIASVVGAILAVLTADGFDVITADWRGILIAAAVAGFISLAKGIVANAATKTGPSLTNAEVVTSAARSNGL